MHDRAAQAVGLAAQVGLQQADLVGHQPAAASRQAGGWAGSAHASVAAASPTTSPPSLTLTHAFLPRPSPPTNPPLPTTHRSAPWQAAGHLLDKGRHTAHPRLLARRVLLALVLGRVHGGQLTQHRGGLQVVCVRGGGWGGVGVRPWWMQGCAEGLQVQGVGAAVPCPTLSPPLSPYHPHRPSHPALLPRHPPGGRRPTAGSCSAARPPPPPACARTWSAHPPGRLQQQQ